MCQQHRTQEHLLAIEHNPDGLVFLRVLFGAEILGKIFLNLRSVEWLKVELIPALVKIAKFHACTTGIEFFVEEELLAAAHHHPGKPLGGFCQILHEDAWVVLRRVFERSTCLLALVQGIQEQNAVAPVLLGDFCVYPVQKFLKPFVQSI